MRTMRATIVDAVVKDRLLRLLNIIDQILRHPSQKKSGDQAQLDLLFSSSVYLHNAK